jgi:hypothetical protein
MVSGCSKSPFFGIRDFHTHVPLGKRSLVIRRSRSALSALCQFIRCAANGRYTAAISWVLTSNSAENVPETVRSRWQVIEIPDLKTEQLQEFAVKKGVKRTAQSRPWWL